MSRVLHTVRLTSRQHYGAKAPPQPLGEVLRLLPEAVRRCICMGFTGRSTSKGSFPSWLDVASDIRLVGYEGQQDTLLHLESPRFGEAAADLYGQLTLWPVQPSADDTGLDLLGDVLTDVNAEAEDSDRFDRSLLRCLTRFRNPLADGFAALFLSGHRYSQEQPAVLTAATIETACRLDRETPPPQRARIVGLLDRICLSTQSFRLILDDQRTVRGVLVGEGIDKVANLLGQRVLVHGQAVYRPSGQLLRLDVERIDYGADEPSIWSRVPPARTHKLDVIHFRQPQGPHSGMAAVIGQWPGDESDEEIAQALKELS